MNTEPDTAKTAQPEAKMPFSPVSRIPDTPESAFQLAKQRFGLRYGVRQNENQIRILDEELSRVRKNLLQKITDAVGPDGKPLYSNDAKRQAALIEALDKDEQYAEKSEILNHLRRITATMHDELELVTEALKITHTFMPALLMPPALSFPPLGLQFGMDPPAPEGDSGEPVLGGQVGSAKQVQMELGEDGKNGNPAL